MKGLSLGSSKKEAEDDNAEEKQTALGRVQSKIVDSFTTTHVKSIHPPDLSKLSDDPVEFTYQAFAPIFNFHKKDLDHEDFRIPPEHLKAYFHKSYTYRANCAEFTLNNLEAIGRLYRSQFMRGRLSVVRSTVGAPTHKKHVGDALEQSGLEDSHRARDDNELSIALVADQRVSFLDGGIEEERTSSFVGVYRMRRGKLISGDIASDSIGNTHLNHEIGPIECCIS